MYDLHMNLKTQEAINRYYGHDMPTRSELVEKGYKLHHFATSQGYVSRRIPGGLVFPYDGHFGVGYKIYIPRYDTTQFCTVAYWVMEDDDELN